MSLKELELEEENWDEEEKPRRLLPPPSGSCFVKVHAGVVFSSYAACAQHSCLKTIARFPKNRKQIASSLRAVAARRSAQVRALRQIPGVRELLPKYSHLCQPAAVRIRSAHFACRQAHWCPWCWVREHTLPLFKKLDAFYSNDLNRAAFKLLLVETRTRRPAADAQVVPGDWTAAEAMEIAKARKDVVTKRPLPRRKSAGAFRFVSVAPVFEKKSDRVFWEIHHRLLAIVPQDFPEPRNFDLGQEIFEFENSDREVVCYTEPDRKQLVEIVGRALRYPADMLH